MKKNNVSVSIIIPVYNVEMYIEECLESVINQTLRNIEIICVDDASTDNSLSILHEYEKKDSRIRIYSFDVTKSALAARKKGVELASGEYLLFLDADDFLEPKACEDIYLKIVKENVEILHFNSKIENCSNAPVERIEMNERLLRPHIGRLCDEEIFNACFQEKKYGFTLWNKMFSTKLCKYAFTYMVDSYMPKAQDMYSYFIISYFAKSYLGWDSKQYYHYCFGRGVTGASIVTIPTFTRYCLQSEVIKELENFCISQNIPEKKDIVNRYKEQWIGECIDIWYKQISKNNDATKILLNSWRPVDIITKLSEKYWYNRDAVATKLKDYPFPTINEKKVKTIAIYYYHFTIGGIQRVISLLIPLFCEMGYKIIFVTDKEPSEGDLIINQNVERVIITDYQTRDKTNYRERAQQWKKIIKEYSIDIMLYHAWTSPLLLWDMLVLKMHGIPVYVQTHSIFSYSLLSLGVDFGVLPKVMSLCDGIIVLSPTDKAFWGSFNDNVHYIPNPVNSDLKNTNKTSGNKKNIIWIGRFSTEKQPWEAINIAEKIIKNDASVRLMMVGDSSDSSLMKKYIKMAEQKGILNNIDFLGYQDNVNQYYSKAAVNLITSTYEGFGMTLLEAQAHGVPTVMYSMPYLALVKENSGIISIEPGNNEQAQNAITELLYNPDKWKLQSENALNSFKIYVDYDYEKSWRSVFAGKRQETCAKEDVTLMLETLINHYKIGWTRNHKTLTALQDVSFSNSKSKVQWFLRKVYGGILCYQEHGFRYTLKRTLEHLGIPMGIELEKKK